MDNRGIFWNYEGMILLQFEKIGGRGLCGLWMFIDGVRLKMGKLFYGIGMIWKFSIRAIVFLKYYSGVHVDWFLNEYLVYPI